MTEPEVKQDAVEPTEPVVLGDGVTPSDNLTINPTEPAESVELAGDVIVTDMMMAGPTGPAEPAKPVEKAKPKSEPKVEPKKKKAEPEPPPQKYVYQALIPNTDLGRYVFITEVVKLDSPLPENLCRVETAAEMAARGARGTPKPAHWRFSGKHDA